MVPFSILFFYAPVSTALQVYKQDTPINVATLPKAYPGLVGIQYSTPDLRDVQQRGEYRNNFRKLYRVSPKLST